MEDLAVGSTVTLKVSAESRWEESEGITYQWYGADGEAITGATGSSYTVTKAAKAETSLENGTVTYQWYDEDGEKIKEATSESYTVTDNYDGYYIDYDGYCVVSDGNRTETYRFNLTVTAKDTLEVIGYINDEESDEGNLSKYVTDAAKAPTCEATGLTEGSHCSTCGEVITAQQTIAATGHSWNDGVVTKEATATATGAVYKVTGTNTVEYKSASKKAKSVTIASTVTLNGVKYKVTSIAAKAFKGNKKIKSVVIPASVKNTGISVKISAANK